MKQIVLERFFDNVRKKGNQIAVQDPNNGTLTFRELAMWSGKVYQYLKRKGIGKEDFVVICIPRSIFDIAAVIGVMRAGAAFTITETGIVPEQRLQYIIKDCNAKIVMNEQCWKDIENEELTEAFSGFDYCEVEPHDAAYAVYTSGSTGQPKGCLQEYGNYEYIIQSFFYDGKPCDDEDIFANVTPMNVLTTIECLVCAMLVGIVFNIVPLHLLREPAALAEYFAKYNITFTCLSPSLLRLLQEWGGV